MKIPESLQFLGCFPDTSSDVCNRIRGGCGFPLVFQKVRELVVISEGRVFRFSGQRAVAAVGQIETFSGILAPLWCEV
jgi:hypothetical protein